jgi:hypothetical protein
MRNTVIGLVLLTACSGGGSGNAGEGGAFGGGGGNKGQAGAAGSVGKGGSGTAGANAKGGSTGTAGTSVGAGGGGGGAPQPAIVGPDVATVSITAGPSIINFIGISNNLAPKNSHQGAVAIDPSSGNVVVAYRTTLTNSANNILSRFDLSLAPVLTTTIGKSPQTDRDLTVDRTGNAYLGTNDSQPGGVELLRIIPDGTQSMTFDLTGNSDIIRATSLGGDGDVYAWGDGLILGDPNSDVGAAFVVQYNTTKGSVTVNQSLHLDQLGGTGSGEPPFFVDQTGAMYFEVKSTLTKFAAISSTTADWMVQADTGNSISLLAVPTDGSALYTVEGDTTGIHDPVLSRRRGADGSLDWGRPMSTSEVVLNPTASFQQQVTWNGSFAIPPVSAAYATPDAVYIAGDYTNYFSASQGVAIPSNTGCMYVTKIDGDSGEQVWFRLFQTDGAGPPVSMLLMSGSDLVVFTDSNATGFVISSIDGSVVAPVH